MASLGSLYSELNYWNNQVNELNDKMKKLKKRRSDVEGVKSALQSTASNNSSDVNNKICKAAQKLESAIEHSGKEGQLDGILAGKNEQPVGGDGYLSSADSEIQRELNDTNRKISEAESELARAKGKVRELKAAIAAEEERQRQEAMRKAAEAIANAFKN